ncbi:fibronectin type III domain-containing protein [Patescibacteria group bacterium]|nr:fibronectin type III domain-containing protein [Patescibacteria group bacterium]
MRIEKRILSIILFFLAVSVLFFGQGANKAKAADVLISVEPVDMSDLPISSIANSGTFKVNIKVDANGNQVGMIQTDLDFNPTLVQAVSVTYNDTYVDMTPDWCDGIYTCIIDNDPISGGKVSLMSVFPSDLLGYFPTGNNILITINFTAASSPASGVSNLIIPITPPGTLIVADPLGTDLPYSITPSSIIVGSDTTPPAAITNLAVSATTNNSSTLTWTAPGDDNNTGTAATYDIRYSTATINGGNWASATAVTGEPTPSIASTPETMTVSGLLPGTTYYFAIKTSDEVPNTSAISNIASGTTTGASNSAPVMTAITITPNPAYKSTATLTANPSATDVNSDPITFTYQWKKGGADIAGQVSSTLSNSNFVKGDTITVTVTPNDGTINGAPMTSGGLTIFNSAPVMTAVTITPSPAYKSTVLLTANPSVTDADGDIITIYAYQWKKGGVDITVEISSTLSNTNYIENDVITVTVTPNDGTIDGAPMTSVGLTISTIDSIVPAAITDLAVDSKTTNSVTLSWTAPGDDDNSGTVTSYDVRYSSIHNFATEANWDTQNLPATGEPAPAIAGTRQTMTISGLGENVHYYFAVKTSDEQPNISAISNVVDTIPGAPTISETTPVSTPTADTIPNYVFTSDEAGTITYGGDCSSATTSASVGANIITFNTLTDGAHNNCTITVTDAAGNPSNILAVTAFTIYTASSAKNITSFNFTSPAVTGAVNNTAHTVALTVPYGTSVIALAPTIAVSANATISPLSGVAQNFTSPVTYTVTAEDATTQAYTATVTVAAAPSSGGGGGGGYTPPTSAVTNTSISINSGAVSTNNPAVTLTIGATNAAKMTISNNSNFTGAVWEAYATSKAWTLTSGDGTKTVYIKFQDIYGVATAAISDAITLDTSIIIPSYSDGALLKSATEEKVYVIKNGEKEWIKTAEEFAAGGYKWENIKIISKEELDTIPNYGSGGGSNPDPVPAGGFSDGALVKISDSFRVYVIIGQKKKRIPTPEVFETLGYKWGNVTIISKADLDKILDYEDNLIRTIGDYKVYLVVNGIRRHIPNPEIFLDYGFTWSDVKDVPSETITKYKPARLVRESKQGKIYYLSALGVKKWIPTAEIFTSYGNKWEDIQVISKKEMDSYATSNLMKLIGSPDVYLIENNTKRLIPSAEIFNKNKYDWAKILEANKLEFDWYKTGAAVK